MFDSLNQAGNSAGSQFGRQILSEATDGELLAALSANQTEVFWHLWNRYEEAIYQVCLREKGGQTADAEDALSQVRLKAWECLPAYAPEITHLKAWLSQVARNLCIDLRRKERQQSEVAEQWKVIVVTEPKAEEPMLVVEQNREIRLRIAALPPTLREPFELYAVREIPVKQVASQLGLSPANVRKRVQLARARLRRQIESGEPVSEDPAGEKKRRLSAGTAAAAPFVELGECFPLAMRTVCVKLACGVEELFHVFFAQTPFATGRKMKSLRSQLLKHPDHSEKRLELGDLFYYNGEWAKAVDEWQHALNARPHLPTALKLGQVLLKLGQFDNAATVFNHIRLKKSHSVVTARHLDGWIAYCQKNASQSVREFQAAADLELENPLHWHGLAVAHQMAGWTPHALMAIQRALEINANDLVALSLSHKILVDAGTFDEAARHAQRLLNLFPNDLLTLRRLIDCRCQLKLTQGAAGLETKQLVRRAVRLSRNSFLMHGTLSAFFLSQGEPKKALSMYRGLADRHPQCPVFGQNRLNLRAAGHGNHLPKDPHSGKLSTAKDCREGCPVRDTDAPHRA